MMPCIKPLIALIYRISNILSRFHLISGQLLKKALKNLQVSRFAKAHDEKVELKFIIKMTFMLMLKLIGMRKLHLGS